MKPDLRVYGEVRGLSPEAWAKLAPACPLEGAAYHDGVLTLEHEGGWVDAASFLDAVVGVLPPGGEGYADIIDNEAWTLTRCRLEPGNIHSQQFGIDDVLENTKGEGNL